MSDTEETTRPIVGPGTVLRHRDGMVVIVRQRKVGDDGWWLYEHGGLSDHALASGDWSWVADSITALADYSERMALAYLEAANPGIDMSDVAVRRRVFANLARGGRS